MTDTHGLSADKRALLERRLRGARQAGVPLIPQRTGDAPPPLSFAQRQMWVIDQMVPGNPAYNQPFGYRIRGNLDLTALERSFNAIIARHEALRTTFAVADGEPVQVIHPECRIALVVTSLDDLPETERESRLQALASRFSVQSFDLAQLPLIRIGVFVLGKAEHVLIVNTHHIVIDGLSIGLMLDEMHVLYQANVDGGTPTLPILPVQYADFAQWHRDTVLTRPHEAQIRYWQGQLGHSLPVLELSADRPRPAMQSFAGSNVFFSIPRVLADELGALGAREGCTFFMTVLATYGAVLHRYTNADDIIVGAPIANRASGEIERLIGNFLNIIPLRCDLSGDPTFRELLGRVRHVTLDAFSNGDLPFETMLAHAQVERDPSRNPVYQTMLQVLPAAAPRIGDLDVTPFHFDLGIAQLDLSVHLYEEADGYHGRFEYCTDLFRADTIERLASSFRQLLHDVVASPGKRLSELSVLEKSEADRILRAWNATTVAFPSPGGIHELFEGQVERFPDRIAVRSGSDSFSYAALDARANRFAHVLRTHGVGRGDRVGLCVDRGADMLAAVLGVLKAGAAYVPLDPSFPAERLRLMADDAELALLVSTAARATPFDLARERCLLLDADAERIAAASTTRIAPDARSARAEDPAYVIYTSGSTGRPKGVVVPHRSVVNFLASMARAPGLTADDVLVAVTTLSFDISVLELQLPLSQGATVVIASRDEAMNGATLAELLNRQQATVMQATPVSWRLLLEAGWADGRGFKALVGGEALPADLAEQLLATGAELWNMYGPTETTVWSTCARITDTAAGVTIGTPIANTTVYVLDPHGHLCPIGVPGELCIGGAGVTLGYWRRPELTAERFIADPFNATPDARLYRTGDRARWRADGTLEHLGRLDFQVKIRGFRVELEEIEALLAEHPAVHQAAVHLWTAGTNDVRIVACCVPTKAGALAPVSLRKHLRARLPEYMIPQYFLPVTEIPLTPNGKVDRRRLPIPVGVESSLGQHEPPADAVEIAIADIWTRLIQPARPVGRNDRFFELGGHSLLAIRALRQMEEAFGRRLDFQTLFANNLAEIANRFRS